MVRSRRPACPGPIRTCVGCRERTTAAELLRVVVGDVGDGPEVVPDVAGRLPGRGAHLHPDPACLELALRRRAFPRALRVGGGLRTARLEAHLQQAEPRTEPNPRGSTSS